MFLIFAILDYRSLDGRLGPRFGNLRLIVVESRLQRLRRLGGFFCGTVSGLFPALQALGHPFPHIALVAYWRTREQSAPVAEGIPGASY
jgi:hypothetical protein